DIHATFATVGFLFCNDKKELLGSLPTVLPDYTKIKYSPYAGNYLDQLGTSEQEDIYHYGHSLIQLIKQHPQHEIGTHTFSHYYCLEGASLESFEADLICAKKVATENGIEIKSIVFPRNQYSNLHIALCKKHGMTSYRGNEVANIYQPRKNNDLSLKLRMVRLLDSYFNLTGHNTHEVFKQDRDEIANIPSSAFLRPYSKKTNLLRPLQLRRIKNSLLHAAKNGKTYHLWWHPHNFGSHLEENLDLLRQILAYYQELHQQYGLSSCTMTEIANKIRNTNEG
ncbi:MAG: polysaccharide deacetylase, partial [Chitinophagaceae bacterium]